MDISAYQSQLMKNAQELLGIDSPSGFTQAAAAFLSGFAARLGYETEMTNKGNVIVHIPGRESGQKVALCAHVDTLGLMVRSITADGQLKITRVGGPILPTLDGEYCTIRTRDGRSYTGTILSLSPAVHVYDDASTRARDEDNMAVRIDEVVRSREDVEALGIRPGDYVCIDPKTVVTGSGFLKSRFIDDKGSAACLLTLMQVLSDKGMKPMYDTRFIFSVHEEVGHGGATVPHDLDELLIVDMGCVGLDLTCTEYQVSICAKDSGGPYDYGMVTRLVNLARQGGVDYAVDIYPHYSSDATVAWRAGADERADLIGPGVDASPGRERTHCEGMKNTVALCLLYLEAE